jgi:hypothetical protein
MEHIAENWADILTILNALGLLIFGWKKKR